MSNDKPPNKPLEKEHSYRQGRSVKAHLLDKARKCVNHREIYVKKLGDAHGNEVFKYLLLLNCIECQGYVAEIQLQAHQSFWWSCIVGLAGFVLVVVGVTIAVISNAGILKGLDSLDIAFISSGSGVVVEFISAIFLYLYNRSLKRMDNFHHQLREAQKLIVSLFLNGLVHNSNQRDEIKKAIIEILLPFSDQQSGEQAKSTHPA